MDDAANIPLTWVKKLCKELDCRQKKVCEAENWYEGEHPVPAPPPNTYAATDGEARLAFIAMSNLSVTNFLPPIVDVPASKLIIEGFRFGDSPTSTDREAWAIWQRNCLDADHTTTNTEALKTGQAPVLVWPGKDGKAVITVEDPSQSIVAYVAGSRRARAAGLKRWIDDSDLMFATLYLPDGVYKFQSTQKVDDAKRNAAELTWQPREVPGESWPVPNPWGIVPLIEIAANRPLKAAPFGGGVPEFQKQINQQRQINQTVMNMLVTAEYQAYRQRWVTGWDPPLGVDGTPDKAAMLKAGASRMVTFKELPDKELKVGEFAQADFQPFIAMAGMFVKVMASNSATPPYAFLIGDMINVAADSLARIDAAQNAKVERHFSQLGQPWQEIVSLALTMEGNAKGSDTSGSVVWADQVDIPALQQVQIAAAMAALGPLGYPVPPETVYMALPNTNAQDAARFAKQAEGAKMLEPVPADTAAA